MDSKYHTIYQRWLQKDVADNNNVFTIHAETYRLPLKLAEIISQSEAELVKAEISNEARNHKLFLEIMPTKGEIGLKKLMELLEANGDEKLLCYLRSVQGLGDPQQKIWGNVPIENRCFIGRESTTELIKAKFDEAANKTSRVIVVVCGLGGVGKTQIAADFVYKTESSYKRQVWITASEARCESSFMKLAEELNFTEKTVKANIERVKDWLEKRVPCLIVFDDAENYDQIASYLPKSGCHVLVTSRFTVWPRNTVAECIHLKVFTKEESALFVEKMLQDDETPRDANDVNDLSRILGYLPLALAQACSYVRECLSSISDYVVLFNSQKQIELLRAQKLPKDMQNDENENTIMVTWNITQAAIQRRSPLATVLLHGCTYFQLDSIPIFLPTTFFFFFREFREISESSIVSGTDEISSFSIDELLSMYFSLECHQEYFIEYSAAMKILTNFAMLTSNTNSEYTMHCLLQKVIKIQKSIEEGDNHYVFEKNRLSFHSIILRLACDNPAADPSKLSKKFRSLLPHVLEHIRAIESYNKINSDHIIHPSVVEIQKEIASVISVEFGMLEQARTLIEEILKSKQARCLHDDCELACELARTLYKLGDACFMLGDTKKAQECFQRSLVIQEKKLDADDPEIASTLVQLANTFCRMEDIERSCELFERAIKMQMNHPHLGGPEQFADSLLGLAQLMNSREEYSKEKDLLEKAMPFVETMKGLGYCKRGFLWAELGRVNFMLKNVQAAKELLEKGLNILDEFFENEGHPSLPGILSNLGLVHGQLGDQTKAKESFEKALTMAQKFVPSDSLDFAAILENLACVNIQLHQLGKAIELCENAVSIEEKHRGSNMHTADLLFLLGNLYFKVGEDKSCDEIIEKHRKIIIAHSLNNNFPAVLCELIMEADLYKTFMLARWQEKNLVDDFHSNLAAEFSTSTFKEKLLRRKTQDRNAPSASQFGYVKITPNLENLFRELNKKYSFEKYLLFDKFNRTNLIRLEEANNILKMDSLKITDVQITNFYSLLSEGQKIQSKDSLNALGKLLKWPKDLLIPVLNVFQVSLLTDFVADHFFGRQSEAFEAIDFLCRLAADDTSSPHLVRLFVCRIIANLFQFPSGRDCMLKCVVPLTDFIFKYCICLPQGPLQIPSAACVLSNFAKLLAPLQGNDERKNSFSQRLFSGLKGLNFSQANPLSLAPICRTLLYILSDENVRMEAVQCNLEVDVANLIDAFKNDSDKDIAVFIESLLTDCKRVAMLLDNVSILSVENKPSAL